MTSTVFDLVGRHAIEKGLPWTLRFTRYAGPARTPIDLTGCKARLEIFDALSSGAPLASLTSDSGAVVLGGSAGSVIATLTGAVSAGWVAKSLRYRFFFIDSLGVEQLYLRGRLGLLDADV